VSSDFSLKQFDIKQDRTAMKVGTDGLLLGAWAQGGKRVLDIGTGTGLIALMMAQRFHEAHVDAIDIDADAASQAEDNACRSPFADRVAVRCVSLQEYVAERKYDSIVCNPPFFTQSLQSPDSKRTLARHSVALPFDDLFRHARRLMSDDGVLSIVVPSDALSQIETAAVMNNLFLVRRCFVRTTRKKPARRLLLSFSQKPSPFHDEEGVIQEAVNEPSEWYRNLTCDFLLKY
jgi:tRNA1Val (adenine37-N6)-methyltransferase